MLTSRQVLVVAPHPDDETLGAGGTLLKLAKAGAQLHWLLVTSAEGVMTGVYVRRQQAQVEAVRGAYPFDGFDWLRLPTTRLGGEEPAALIDKLGTIVNKVRPDTILVPHAGDAHDDHAACHAAALAACKSFRMAEMGVSRVLAMEIPSETDAAAPTPDRSFLPTVTVDISDELPRKL